MECFIVNKTDVDLANGTFVLTGEEAHHAAKSLRLVPGDHLIASDLEGTCYRAIVDEVNRKDKEVRTVRCKVEEVLPEFGESKINVSLLVGVLSQPSRWEFLLEKATELGVNRIIPLKTERSETHNIKLERSERILLAAVKQSKRAHKPKIELSSDRQPLSLDQALEHAEPEIPIFVFHESADLAREAFRKQFPLLSSPESIVIAIGPEGGFSDEEIVMTRERFNAQIVSLGSRRLRSETAALAALAIVNT